jgi:hypothetical protein
MTNRIGAREVTASPCHIKWGLRPPAGAIIRFPDDGICGYDFDGAREA